MTAIGERWPHPHPGGMQAVLAPDEEAGLQLTLVAACDRPTEPEREALAGPLRLGILSHPPLAWITLHAGILSWDAPYAAGITAPDHAAAIGVGARRAAGLPDRFRALVVITILDSGIVARNRAISLSRDWWRALAGAIMAGPISLDHDEYQRAVARDQARLTTAQMTAAAQAVEIGGAV